MKKMAHSMIKYVHGVVHGRDSAEYHCECGGYLCIRPIGMLERYPGPARCQECGALIDWGQAIEWQRIIAEEMERKDGRG